MTRNDTFFKILFAIEIALLPLVMASYIIFAEWTVGLFIAAVLVVKIWMELFKNKASLTHLIINSIGNILTISSLVIFFTIYDYINIVLCVFVVILAVLMNLFKVLLREKSMPEMIEAVDSCYMLFECLTLVGLTFLILSQLVTNIGLFALLLTAGVSVAYKIFYSVRYYDAWGKTKNFFARLFKRK